MQNEAFFLRHLTICLWMMAFHYFKMHLDCIVIKIYSPEGSHYKVSPFESVGGVSRRDVVMNPFIFLLTRYRQKHSFYINLGSDYSN